MTKELKLILDEAEVHFSFLYKREISYLTHAIKQAYYQGVVDYLTKNEKPSKN